MLCAGLVAKPLRQQIFNQFTNDRGLFFTRL